MLALGPTTVRLSATAVAPAGTDGNVNVVSVPPVTARGVITRLGVTVTSEVVPPVPYQPCRSASRLAVPLRR